MRRWVGSLRLRLLGATLATLAVALIGAHWWLASQFRQHVVEQFDLSLVQQLDQLTARLEFNDQGLPVIGARGMSDPRWEKAYSGLYWQVERLADAGPRSTVALRSRSLWDAELSLPGDALPDGAVHRHDSVGPQGESLRVVERSLRVTEPGPSRWRLIVAGDLHDGEAAVEHFNGVLALSLGGLGGLLALVALAQVGIGLSPLRAMQAGLQRVRQGQVPRLQGRYPSEVQPLIDEFNGVLDRNDELIERARAQAGNLAHVLKTPLAILGQAARQAGPSEFSALVQEQVQLAERHMQWHLARARAAAQQLPGQRTPIEPVLNGLLRAMDRLHADRHLDLGLNLDPQASPLTFAGEAQDLQEMVGNLLDNACRSAQTAVSVRAVQSGNRLHITVDDDGPGIAPEQRAAVLQRGVRLDETRAGSGLGLAIVVDLARLYGGDLTLDRAAAGGLSARLELPATS